MSAPETPIFVLRTKREGVRLDLVARGAGAGEWIMAAENVIHRHPRAPVFSLMFVIALALPNYRRTAEMSAYVEAGGMQVLRLSTHLREDTSAPLF